MCNQQAAKSVAIAKGSAILLHRVGQEHAEGAHLDTGLREIGSCKLKRLHLLLVGLIVGVGIFHTLAVVRLEAPVEVDGLRLHNIVALQVFSRHHVAYGVVEEHRHAIFLVDEIAFVVDWAVGIVFQLVGRTEVDAVRQRVFAIAASGQEAEREEPEAHIFNS